jgi:hypothetical protein
VFGGAQAQARNQQIFAADMAAREALGYSIFALRRDFLQRRESARSPVDSTTYN